MEDKVLNIFKTKSNINKALVFVDYEYWFYSYKNKYSMRPNLSAWRQALENQYQIVDIMVFADFSCPAIGEELARLRSITNTIIETGTANQKSKKDMTDFVMLDYIYQSVTDREDIGTYVIFTGDGHFQSVIKYLIQKCRKNVVVYGVDTTFSKRLQMVANNFVLLPSRKEIEDSQAALIIKHFARQGNRKTPQTYWDIIDNVAKANNIPKETVKSALVKLVAGDYIHQKEIKQGKENLRVLVPNWERIRMDGLNDN